MKKNNVEGKKEYSYNSGSSFSRSIAGWYHLTAVSVGLEKFPDRPAFLMITGQRTLSH